MLYLYSSTTTGTRVPLGTRVRYTCTNITLSQKQLEMQALRCNGDTSGRCQYRRHHGILQLRFQLDSDVPWYSRVPLVPCCWYHGTRVPYGMAYVYHWYAIPWYHGTIMVPLAHMLARIVVEIRAADIAVELEPQLQYTVMSSMLTTPTSVPVAPGCLYFKSFLR